MARDKPPDRSFQTDARETRASWRRHCKRCLGVRLPLAALACIALLASGCGTGGVAAGGNTQNGKTLFTSRCASCHTLGAAGASGKVGPNLDEAFAAMRASGRDTHFEESTIKQVVADQIKYPAQRDEGVNMPANLVKGSAVDDVAAYVASVAGTKSSLAGEVDLYTAPEFKQQLLEVITQDARHVVVDFSDTTFIDSTTLGVLVGGVKRLRTNDGQLSLVCSDRNITKIFEITGLDRVFTIFPTRADAIATLGVTGNQPPA